MNMATNKGNKSDYTEAYWISPEGEILQVHTSHIDMAFDQPELFGLSLQLIQSVYDIYNEQYRSEGKARDEMLVMIFKQGWIRARRYLRPYRWSINAYSIDEKTSLNLKHFALSMMDKGHFRHDEVMIDTDAGKSLCCLADMIKV